MERIHWERLASILISLTLGGFLFFLAWRHLFPVLLPFLIALLLARALRRPARAVARLVRLPEGVVAVVLLLLSVSLGGFLSWLLLFYLGKEALSLVERLLSDGTLSALLKAAEAWLAGLLAPLGASGASPPSLSSLLFELLGAVASRLPAYLSDVLSALPQILFFGVLVLVSGVYFCLDRGRSERFLLSLCPDVLRVRLSGIYARCGCLLRRYLRAYLSLFALTLALLLFGFLLLGIENALLLALLISLADLLPVIGVGTVLLPWGGFLLLTGESARGLSLLVLYLVVSVTRQLAEPRILGRSLGLHPILTLLLSFAGLRLLGLWGLLLAPLAAILLQAIAEREEK